MVISRGFGRGVCVCVGGGVEYSGGSDRQRAADREQVRRERVQVQLTVRLCMASTFYRGIRKICTYRRVYLFNQIQVLLLMTVYCVDLCKVFFFTTVGIAGSGDS